MRGFMQSLSIKGTKAYCFDPHFNKPMLMGTVIGDTLFKSVNDRHFMRTVGGYGFQYDAFACLEQNGIKKLKYLSNTPALLGCQSQVSGWSMAK